MSPMLKHIQPTARKIAMVSALTFLGNLFMNAQHSNLMYHMQMVPQSHYLNPAKQPQCSFYLGFPGLTSVYANYGNNSFGPFDVIFPGAGAYADSLISILHPSYNLDDFINKLRVSNLQSVDLNETLLSMGFRAGKSYVNLDLITRAYARVSLPGDLIALGLKGNGDFIGKEANLSPLRLNATAYHEMGVGISNQISNKLTIGYRPKLLFGMANVSMANPVPDIGLYTDPDNFDLTFHSRMAINVSAPIKVITNAEGEIDDIEFLEIEGKDVFKNIMNFKNLGAGLDLGAEYRFTDQITFSASLLDLGFIHWGSNTYKFEQDGQFVFTGFDLSEGLVENSDWDFEEEAEALGDSIVDLFTVTNKETSYMSYLSPKLYLAASYDLNEMLRFGILSRTEYFGKRFRQSLTLSANAYLARFFNLSASYTMMNQTYNNLGLGLAIKGGPFHFYLVTESMPFTWTKIRATEEDFSDLNGKILPSNLKSLNVRFGLNLVFGCRNKKLNDQPLLLTQ